jgi:hypothetical protein
MIIGNTIENNVFLCIGVLKNYLKTIKYEFL